MKFSIVAMGIDKLEPVDGTFHPNNKDNVPYIEEVEYEPTKNGSGSHYKITSTHIDFNYEHDKHLIVKGLTIFSVSDLPIELFYKNDDIALINLLISLTAELTYCHLAHVRGMIFHYLSKHEIFTSSPIPIFDSLETIHSRLKMNFNLNLN